MGGMTVTILRLRRLPSLDVLIQMLGRRPTTSPCRLPDARQRRDEPLRPTFRFPFITLPSPRLLSFFLSCFGYGLAFNKTFARSLFHR